MTAKRPKGKSKKKPWFLMTEEEIGEIVKKWCSKCQYRSGTYGEGAFEYLLVTGHMRGCRPDECDKFKKGARLKKSKNLSEEQAGEYSSETVWKEKEGIDEQ